LGVHLTWARRCQLGGKRFYILKSCGDPSNAKKIHQDPRKRGGLEGVAGLLGGEA